MWGCSAVIEVVDSKAEVFTMTIPEGGLYDEDLREFLAVCQEATLPIVSAHIVDSSYPFGHPKRLEVYLFATSSESLAFMQIADLPSVNHFYKYVKTYDLDRLNEETAITTNV